MLRRSLDDAEGLSRDAKKEWAILRSQKLSLEESVVSAPQKYPLDLHTASHTPSGMLMHRLKYLPAVVFSAGDSDCRAGQDGG